MHDSDEKMLAAIENLGLTIEQLGEAYTSGSYINLHKVLSTLDNAKLVDLTSQLAVHSMVILIQMNEQLQELIEINGSREEKIKTVAKKAIDDLVTIRKIENDGTKMRKSAQTRKAANVKASKQSAENGKPIIKTAWLEWKEKSHQYESNNGFAKQMVEGKADFADIKTIKDTWIKEWAQEAIKQAWDDWQKSDNPQTLYASDDAFANAMFTKYHETKGNKGLKKRSNDLKGKIKEDCLTWQAELLQK
jgi:hypothetical protein